MPCAGTTVKSGKAVVIIPCQFSSDFQEGDLMDVDGKKLCPFHAPLEDENGNLTTKGGWTPDKIEEFYADISRLRVSKLCSFQGDTLDLRGVIFPSYPEFRGIEFPFVDFSYAQFHNTADFRDANFTSNVKFTHAQFKVDSLFNLAQFRGPLTIFGNTKFNDLVDFTDSNFEGKIDFRNAEFEWHVDFKSSGKNHEAEAFQGEVNFSGAKFLDEVNFNNRKFRQETSFKNCTFHKAPRFHNCQLHQDTNFKDAKFLDTKSDDAIGAYQTLKLDMENKRARQEQLMFYALEMKSRRSEEKRKFLKLLSWLYEKTSDYGQKIFLPLVWLVCSYFICATIYTIFFNELLKEHMVHTDNLHLFFRFSLEQIVRPFGALDSSSLSDLLNKISPANLLSLRFITTLQSFSSLVLLLLSGLAARWRFKIG